VVPLGPAAGAVALNKDTGKEVWRSEPIAGKLSYASPISTTIADVDQVLVLSTTTTAGVSAKTGQVLWSSDDYKCQIPIASPFPLGDGRVFVTNSYNAGAIMFKVEKQGDRFVCNTLFKTKDINGQIHQPILHQGFVYLNGNDKSKRFGFLCADLDGNVEWQTDKSPGFDWGGYLLADGMLYVIDGNTGDLCLVEPNPAGYKELGRVKLLGTRETWGTVALSDGKLLIRDQTQMKCVDVRGK